MTVHNQLMDILNDSIEQPYKYGVNDCNIVALRVIDLFLGTTWATIAKYKSIKTGLKQLSSLGFDSTQDIIRQECVEVDIPIDGDIWLDDENDLVMAVVTSGRMLGVNSDHTGFELIYKKTNGKFYRPRKV